MENKHVPQIRFVGFTGDWAQRKLGDLVEKLEYGLNANGIEYDGENKYIRITDIDDSSHKFLKGNLTTPNTDLSLADNYLLKPGDILFARTGASVGKSYIYNSNDGKVYYAGFLIRARIKTGYNPEFVFQNTLTTKYNNYIAITSQRSGQPGVNAKEYSNYPIMIPELNEQTKIGSFFKQLNDIITLHQQELTTLKQTKQGFLQKMFPKEGETVPEIRFPGFTGEWEQKPLKELVERITRKNKNLESKLPLTISAQFGLVDQETFFNKTVASTNLEGYYLLYNGEFAYNKSYSKGYPLGTVKRLEKHDKGVLSSLYICFKPLSSVSSDFLTHYFESTAWHKEVSMISVEGARNHGLLNISVSDFFGTSHFVPTLEEQNKIGDFFNRLDRSIALKQSELDTVQKTKKAFLQKMFV
ncbi:restriction endonuclease subunit S [Virgibacillus halodenitrificans]|uniref:restriction endonuclease subunit S n=1 Tax=Virgibacillus halodenitrificans TaxID=1482 RepID=UPI0024BF8866|nr:restriction endonuclease subunit S [Virgibacillus halodenitrificans]WHX25027.1 restriction endonuclease subunit S [Virgibacillus halodenitrificans]